MLLMIVYSFIRHSQPITLAIAKPKKKYLVADDVDGPFGAEDVGQAGPDGAGKVQQVHHDQHQRRLVLDHRLVRFGQNHRRRTSTTIDFHHGTKPVNDIDSSFLKAYTKSPFDFDLIYSI